MQDRLEQPFDKVNAAVAGFVFALTLLFFVLTQARTVSLWDCGEFIACSAILGIPHPPGTPLYVLLGRIFSLIPTFGDIGARISFLSPISSSLAAVFAYLSSVRLLRPWLGRNGSGIGRLLVYAGSACAAFMSAFGLTAWNNAVEAEVYGLSMLIMLIIFWLTLRYNDLRETARGERIMLAIVYLGFLGIGAHMSTFLIIPAALIVLIMNKNTPGHYWFMIAAFVVVELYLVFALSSRPGEIPYYVPVIITAVFFIFYVLSFELIPRFLVHLAVGMALSCLPLVGLVRPGLAGIAHTVGIAAAVSTVLYVAYLFFNRSRYGKTGSSERTAIAVATTIVAVGMAMTAILLLNIKGYGPFLFITVALAAMLAVLVWRYISFPVLVGLAGVSLIVIGMRPFFWGSLLAAVVILVVGLGMKMPRWKTALGIILVAHMGFSVHAFIPIRSSLDPYINENHPSDSLDALINFLERKQYGSEGMVERMFVRRAEWENQFGTHARMGFWGFFEEQYGLHGRKFFLLFVLGLFGIWEVIRRRKECGLFMLTLILICTVGLILYMNFADGERMDAAGRDYLEVRDRDYFFTPGFMVFGMAIGIGVVALIQFIRDSVHKFSPAIRTVIVTSSLVLLLLPVYPLAGNYYYCDRTRNYIAYDYAWNLLQSADPGAVLLTGGDNDTFPLWALQSAYGVRPDLKLINLSLANMKWYIRQVRDYMGLDLGMNDQQINDMVPYRLPDGRTFMLADQVVDAIIDHNPDVPVNFSITTTSGSRKYHGSQLISHLVLSGMKFRYDTTAPQIVVNKSESREYFDDTTKFRMRRLADTTFYHNETDRRVIANVANALVMTADGLRSGGDFENAKRFLRKALELNPSSGLASGSLAGIFAEQGQYDSIDSMSSWYPGANQAEIRLAQAQAYRRADNEQEARRILMILLQQYPSYRPALDEMMRSLIKTKDVDAMVGLLQFWLEHNPGDQQIRSALNDLTSQIDLLREQGQDSQ